MSDELLLTLPDDDTPGSPASAASAEAHAHAARGDWTAAERLFDEARGAATRARDDVALAVALTNRGHALARLGRLEEAALTLDGALDARRRLHAAGVAGEAVVARGIADVAAVAAALGDPPEAARLLRGARAHAEAAGASDVVADIDERLGRARALGAVDEATWSQAGDVLAAAALTFESLAARRVADSAAAAGDPFVDALDPGTFEPTGFEPVALEPTAFEAAALALSPAAAHESGTIDLLGLDAMDAMDDDAITVGPALTFLDAEPAAGDGRAEDERPGDAWSLADPSPFEGLDADAVHRRAVALDTKPEGYPAIAFEPTALGSADAMSELDDEPNAALPPVREFPEVYESPLSGASESPAAIAAAAPDAPEPASRRRTTRDVPLVAPPEKKRPWWRRLTPGGRG